MVTSYGTSAVTVTGFVIDVEQHKVRGVYVATYTGIHILITLCFALIAHRSSYACNAYKNVWFNFHPAYYAIDSTRWSYLSLFTAHRDSKAVHFSRRYFLHQTGFDENQNYFSPQTQANLFTEYNIIYTAPPHLLFVHQSKVNLKRISNAKSRAILLFRRKLKCTFNNQHTMK